MGYTAKARYEICVIASYGEALGATISTADDAAEAKRIADANGSAYYYGVAIVDTHEGTVDWGDQVTNAKEARR